MQKHHVQALAVMVALTAPGFWFVASSEAG